MEELQATVDALSLFLGLKHPRWRSEVAAAQEEAEKGHGGSLGWVLQSTKNATLSNGGLTLTKTSGGRAGWDCNALGSQGWTSGVHTWNVRLDTKCEMMIGVAPAATNPVGPNWSSVGYYLGTASGALFGQDGVWKKDYLREKCSRKGCIISVKLDMDNLCVWFGLDGQFPGAPAWTGLPAGVPLHPSFDVDSKGSTFTVVHSVTTSTNDIH